MAGVRYSGRQKESADLKSGPLPLANQPVLSRPTGKSAG